MSGYELTAASARSIGQFWSMSRAGIYRELGRLERSGCVTVADVAQGRRPGKRVYSPTDAGLAELEAWLDAAEVDQEGPKHAFLVKLFFASRMQPGQVDALLEELRARTEHDLGEAAAVHERLSEVEGATFEGLAALHGVRMKQARLRWIGEARRQLRRLEDDHPAGAGSEAGGR